MTREALESYILSTYNATSDFPWARYPSYEVFRHPANQKWFALLADIPASVFTGPTSVPSTHENREEKVCVLNVKCDPVLPFRSEPGIHPAYHMNKDKWISIPPFSDEKRPRKCLLLPERLPLPIFRPAGG